MEININYKGRTFEIKNIDIDENGIFIEGKYLKKYKETHKNEIYSHDGGIYYPYTITEISQEISVAIPIQDIRINVRDEIISKYEGED